ncbi:MAG: hypothetical protein AAB562_04315 [Patescibacteria group bacterium]
MSSKYLKAWERGGYVSHWLAQRNRELDEVVNKEESDEIGAAVAGVVILVLSLPLVVLTLMFAVDRSGHFHWPKIGWAFVLTAVSGFFLWFAGRKPFNARTKELRKIKRAELEAERDQDPFYQRARLLEEALRDFRIHCDRYVAWYNAVDEGLQDGDEEAAERYHAFIARAHAMIHRATNNFAHAVELARRQAEYQKAHPELSARTTSTALSDLIARLDQPTEVPTLAGLADPCAALEYEEALAELAFDPDGRELAAKRTCREENLPRRLTRRRNARPWPPPNPRGKARSTPAV